ncbi:restriction endonuclease subunit S [Halomonas ventosae]|uniref:Type I restriction enzyme S subunit n=1 Tax=Halomonas ventosae TaxID=229007 RepID=A0A2T0VI42_9GAMM|nr:restriction endonuclease subunit S [Halomonas ventosae]PRY69870.1 type I restriction enzyme S subunit [Halomonas ventosae]
MGGHLLPAGGDVLLNSTGTGTIGRSSVFDGHGKFIVDSHVTLLRPQNKKIDPRWLNELLRNPRFQRHLEANCYTGSTNQLELSRSQLMKSAVPTPTHEEQVIIASALRALDTQIQKTEALIAKLEKVKEGLLHDLLTRGIDENGRLRPSPEQAPEFYKESPLGLIPISWGVVRVDELAENHDGQRVPLKKSERKNGIYPYYGASGIIDWVEDYLFDGHYVLLGEDGENVVSRNLPLAFAVSGKFWVNNHAHIYSARDDSDPRFLVEVLEQKDYSRWVNGSAQPKITQASLRMMWFCKPLLDEQVAISNRLEGISQRISREKVAVAKKKTKKSGLMDDLLTGRVRVTPLLDQAQATTPA